MAARRRGHLLPHMPQPVQHFCAQAPLQVRIFPRQSCPYTLLTFPRKCGRVVCNACSPHRIIIPHQYIVRPPGSEIPLPQSLLIDGLGGGYFDVNGLSGGERVRLCNPCVPDPNIAPPHSPVPPQVPSPRSAHHRSRSSLSSAYGPVPSSNRYSAVIPPSSGYEHYRYYSPRTRSITMVS